MNTAVLEPTGTPVRPATMHDVDATPRPLRRQWRIRDLLLARRAELRPGERERQIIVRHFLDRWLRDPIARSVLADILRHTTGFCESPCGYRGDECHRRMRTALLEAFRRRELVVVG